MVNTTQAVTDNVWQPISTAPRDGTAIIGYDPERESVWMGGIEFMRWVNGTWTDPTTHTSKPTHWMPLPRGPHEGT